MAQYVTAPKLLNRYGWNSIFGEGISAAGTVKCSIFVHSNRASVEVGLKSNLLLFSKTVHLKNIVT
jgi:hypothetical protein